MFSEEEALEFLESKQFARFFEMLAKTDDDHKRAPNTSWGE